MSSATSSGRRRCPPASVTPWSPQPPASSVLGWRPSKLVDLRFARLRRRSSKPRPAGASLTSPNPPSFTPPPPASSQARVAKSSVDAHKLFVKMTASTLRRWRDGNAAEVWEAHKVAVQTVLKLPSGELFTGSSDSTVKLWKGRTCLHTFSGHAGYLFTPTLYWCFPLCHEQLNYLLCSCFELTFITSLVFLYVV